MDPLNDGDNGALGGVFDTLTGAVNSIEAFGRTVGGATQFDMSAAMVWSVIAFMFFVLIVRVLNPWNSAAAERWRHTGRIRGGAVSGTQSWEAARIATLEQQVRDLIQQVRDLTGADAPSEETANVDR